MIDLKDLRERPEAYQEACRKKYIQLDVMAFVKLDQEYRQLKTRIDSLRSEQNKVSKEIPTLSGSDKDRKLEEMKALSNQLKTEGQRLKDLEEQWQRDQLLIPSIPLDKVPEGKDDSENVQVRTWGEIPKFDFDFKDHVALGRSLGILDVERGVKIAGARSYFLLGDGARLQHAVLQCAMDLLSERGYLLVDCPHIVKYEAMMGTGYFPGGEEMAYALDERDSGFHLIGTSEVSVCSMHSNEILDETELPLKYAGFSPCYRREAGSYGKDTAGVYRIHQFYKVEQVVICKADIEESAKLHQELLGNSEKLMQMLELPYRVVDVCSGDMGQGQVYKNDIETWMPSRENYGETHSCSTFYDFQARRLMMRYRMADDSKVYCHTLNNTCVASPRILIPLLEVHQTSDGRVRIPAVLRNYMGGQEFIEPRKTA